MIGLRQRNRLHLPKPEVDDVVAGASDNSGSASARARDKTTKAWNMTALLRKVEIWLHVVAILCYVGGFLARKQLHTAVECEMTWSWPHFLPIHFPTSSYYRLFKFADGRDQRHRSFLTATEPLRGTDWCGRKNETHIVLYVHGHWGSYKQARSLGAHGVQLTRAESDAFSRHAEYALANNLWTGVSSESSTFVYDVYSVDFLNQGGALHGQFLVAQSEFISEVIMFLVKSCEAKSITMVAHSVGGYAARLTLVAFPQTRKFVRNIITLATPHDGLPFTLDRSVAKVIEKIKQTKMNDVTLVSICGGMRDEMIPPSTCFVNSSNAITILASDVMKESPSKSIPTLGMDHRAIVWCHNLLSVVRNVVFATKLSDNRNEPARAKLKKIRTVLGLTKAYSFDDSAQAHMRSFRDGSGRWQAALMEAAMLYRLELLLILFALAGTLHYTVGTVHIPLFVPVVVSLCAILWSDAGLQLPSILILVFAGDGVYLAISACLETLQTRFFTISQTFWLRLSVASYALVLLLVEVSWASYTRVVKGHFGFLQWQAAVFLTTILHLYFLLLLSTIKYQVRHVDTVMHFRMISLLLPTFPCLTIGKVMLILWTERLDPSSWGFVWTVVTPIYLWLLATTFGRPKRFQHFVLNRAKPCVVGVGCILYSPRLLCIGCGFRIADLLTLTVCWDVVETIIDNKF